MLMQYNVIAAVIKINHAWNWLLIEIWNLVWSLSEQDEFEEDMYEEASLLSRNEFSLMQSQKICQKRDECINIQFILSIWVYTIQWGWHVLWIRRKYWFEENLLWKIFIGILIYMYLIMWVVPSRWMLKCCVLIGSSYLFWLVNKRWILKFQFSSDIIPIFLYRFLFHVKRT